ncbi:glycosyltransferase family 4 protein [Streptomyces triticirhizae]|uniref:Glycosyltransferase family 1 protein n=1 Tax=Streptomyces triticirhizae TaxID=2483353 RepID=A0A3M2LNJ3_9ACTN|nr:glycosyltransferase family 4 protein [Streptomyces triticirhizae]RMI39031.1 glycosyltransferase family 1 protein [Streptomyces triticirhizae]
MNDARTEDPRYDVCIALNYYAPYVSGLTEVARVLAEGLAARGRSVAVVTSRHDRSLPRRERIAGVEVFRAPVLAHVGRGVVAPGFPKLVSLVARRSRVLNLHLPMLEAARIAARCGNVPVVSTYHIDVWVPRTLTTPLQVAAVNRSARHALARSTAVVVNSEDQARYSLQWPVIRTRPWQAISAPCVHREGGRPVYRSSEGLHVGFLGRIVEDKGIPYLVRAFRRHAAPQDRLLIGGDHEDVRGRSAVAEVRAAIGDDRRITLLGFLRGRQIADFYASIDVFALPSVAESFGIVQAEAMMAGVPCVTSDLPGGRYPVVATGFGRLAPPRDPDAVWRAVEELRDLPAERRAVHAKEARDRFGVAACLDAYQELFDRASSGAPLGHAD